MGIPPRIRTCEFLTLARSLPERHDAMLDTSSIDIDLSAIDHNMAAIRRVVGDRCALCPIVKADAYGLGVARVARRLVAAGAEMLAVYSLRQAIETAAAMNAATPVLVLMPVADLPLEDELARLILAGQLHLVVHDEANLLALEARARALGATIPVHLEIDVGMSRGGALPDEASRILRAMHAGSPLSLRGIFSHFTHSRYDETRTDRQHEIYEGVLDANRRFIPRGVFEHVASTYSLARDARYHRSMARFGLAWLGYGLDELEATSPCLARTDLRPVVRWSSTIVQAKRISAGTGVGYGSRWIADRDSVVGLVPVGYADGYPAPRQPASVGGQFVGVRTPTGEMVYAPVIGAVNMDQITVDLTSFYQGDEHDWIGSAAELIARDIDAPNHLPRLAAQSGMIVHELLTRINPRIPRAVSHCAADARLPAVSIEVIQQGRRGSEASVTAAAAG